MAKLSANQYLPADVAKDYEVVEWHGGQKMVYGHFGIVDLSVMTVARAERLIKAGFTKLRKRKKKKSIEKSDKV